MEKRGLELVLFGAVGITSIALCGTSSAAVPLQLKLAKGKTYYQRTMVDTRVTQTVMEQPKVLDFSYGIGVKLDVLDVDTAGNMQIRYILTWCMVKMTGVTGVLNYDSAQQATPPAGAELLAALVNQSYTVKLTPKGRVLSVEGVEQIRETVEKKVPGRAEAGPLGTLAALFLDQQGVKEKTEGLLAVFPDKPVEQGQSWSGKRVLKVGGGGLEESKWTLQKQEAGVAIIGQTSSIRPNPDAPPMETQGMKVRFDVSGTQEATIRVVEATGLVQMGQSHQQLKGQVQIVGDTGQEQPMTILDTKTKVEMSEKMWEPASQ